jgi:HD-GYP domain-containing protein (c-di-GMP phosphodiesterase class II)
MEKMDKKRQLKFNLNNFLLATSTALDAVEKDNFDISLGHSKRVAYIALKLALEFNYKEEYLFDICAYSLLHSIALSQTGEKSKEYCNLANKYSNIFPFLKKEKDILKYQCEHYDGSGVFGLKGDEIPLFSQFIAFADILDTKFDLHTADFEQKEKINHFVSKNENILFSTDMVECFTEFSSKTSFWLDLQNENEILNFIFSVLNDFTVSLDFEEVLSITSIFTKITNGNLELLDNCSKMADFYEFDHKDKQTFLIAASMANIGKLFIPKRIVEKDNFLNKEEYEIMKSYPYYTKKVLSYIMGFSDITLWASKIQEKSNAKGYPFSLEGKDLSLKDRVLALINSFTALTSKKSYRKAYSKDESFDILRNLDFDNSLVNDLEKVFKKA